MKNKVLTVRKIIFILVNCLTGFITFLFIVLLGELISNSFIIDNEFHLEIIHLQIALLGGILYGSLNLFKTKKKPI